MRFFCESKSEIIMETKYRKNNDKLTQKERQTLLNNFNLMN